MIKRLIVVVIVIAAVGYWRGWFSVTNQGQVAVQVDQTKFRRDKEDFGRAVGEKAHALKNQVADLWRRSEGLTGDEKARAQSELASLETQHARLEQQIRELDDAGEDRFESIKRDLSVTLDEVERKIGELTLRLEKEKGA